jgi:hypothetical protein
MEMVCINHCDGARFMTARNQNEDVVDVTEVRKAVNGAKVRTVRNQ